jgi:hypothetical protein
MNKMESLTKTFIFYFISYIGGIHEFIIFFIGQVTPPSVLALKS